MELLRRIGRAVMGSDSALYSAASSALDFTTTAIREGPRVAHRLRQLALADLGEPQCIKLRCLDHPIFIRPGTPDAKVIIYNIIREDYGFVRPEPAPVSMIDAGAYIGDSAAYFLSQYPDLRIAALEPHPSNYTMSRQNLSPYGDRLRLFNQALSSTPGAVLISGAYEGATISHSGVRVEATTVPLVMSAMGWESLSILKMDVEGEEGNILNESADRWLNRVGLLIVEVHNVALEAVVRRTLKRNGFSIRQFRASWFCQRRGS